MFSDTYELRDLWDSKSTQLRSAPESHLMMDSAFLGPTLWDDSLTISDLDTINLEEFSPSVLEDSIPDGTQNLAFNVEPDGSLRSPDSSKPVPFDKSFSAYGTSEPKNGCISDPCVSEENFDFQVRSRKKTSVPSEQKNDKYWTRRLKNNASAKRSRDARRMMERQVYIKASMLERENEQLREQLNRLSQENAMLRGILDRSPHVGTNLTAPKQAPMSTSLSSTSCVERVCETYGYMPTITDR